MNNLNPTKKKKTSELLWTAFEKKKKKKKFEFFNFFFFFLFLARSR